jgi:membrane associated rhomboid family serine protease
MFLPFGDEPNAPQTPVMTYGLIALNIAVWVFVCAPLAHRPASPSDPQLAAYLHSIGLDLWQGRMVQGISAYDLWLYTHAFAPARFSFVALFTSLFLHAGWLHLLGNMLFLYIFGDNVEAHVGRARYLAIYLVTGALGTLCYTLFRMQSQVPIIGASGAISGILGCYFVWFPLNRVRVFMFFFVFIDVIMVPARIVLGLYLVLENIVPLLTEATTNGGTAYGAHLGGFVAGAAFADVWRRKQGSSGQGFVHPKHMWAQARPRKTASRYAQDPTQPPKLPDAAEQSPLAALVQQSRWQQAAALEASMLRVERARQAPETLLMLADGLTQNQQYQAALAVLQRVIVLYVDADKTEFLARAHLRAGLIQWRGLKSAAAARAHLLAVLDLAADARVHTAATLALQEISVL